MQSDRIWTPDFIKVCLATFSFFVTFVLFFPTLPIFIREQGGDPALIGLLVGGSSIVSISLRPFTGRLVDTIGRKLFLTLGATLLLISTISYDFVTSTTALWPARLLAGAGISFYFTASLAYVADIAPASKRGAAMSYFGMFNNLAMAIGPLVGIWLIKADSLRGLNSRLEGWFPGSGSEVSEEFNFAVLFAVAAVIALTAVIMTSRLHEVHVPLKRGKETLRQMLGSVINRPALLPATLNFLIVINFVSLNIFIPIFGEDLDIPNIGLYYTVMAVAILFSRLFAGPLLDRYPRHRSIIPGMLLMMAGTVLLGAFQEPWMVFVTAGLIGLGSGVAQPGLQALLVDRAEGQNLGSASSTFAMGLDFGLFVGGALMGLILSQTNFTVMFAVSGSSSGVAAVVLAFAAIGRQKPTAAIETPTG